MKYIRFEFGVALGVLLLVSLCIGSISGQSLIDPAIEAKVDSLLGKMTLEEKIGQLNQYSSTFDVTGPAPAAGSNKIRYEQIRKGQVGSMLNVVGADATRRAQQLAVENSRLGIPLILGLDVVHGYRTMFPIPLGEAASWDLDAIEASARVAGTEAVPSCRALFRSWDSSGLQLWHLGSDGHKSAQWA